MKLHPTTSPNGKTLEIYPSQTPKIVSMLVRIFIDAHLEQVRLGRYSY